MPPPGRSWVRPLLVLILIGAAVNNLALCRFTIEDAAIDFAYAEHLVHGDGLVPTPGGEWVEGYSNPTWVALLALSTLLRIDPFFASHAYGLVLSLTTVWVVWRIGLRLAPVESGIPLLAPAFLAASTQFGMWGTAGLENSLWNLLFALGIWRSVVELQSERPPVPWSAVAWLLLSLTRPEGILYAAAAGACFLGFSASRHRSLRPTLIWLALFFVPWTAYQAWRYQTFAWMFPNTYYGKLERHELHPMDWNGRGWRWTRSFFLEYGYGFFLPVWLLGAIGHERWRLGAVAAVFAVVGLSTQLTGDQRLLVPVLLALLWAGMVWIGRLPRRLAVGTGAVAVLLGIAVEGLRALGHAPNLVPVPEWVQWAPPWVLAAAAVAVAGLSVGVRDALVRVPAWIFVCLLILFAVYSEGDWMKGYRWYALATVPAALLFAWGTHAVAVLVEEGLEQPGRDGLHLTKLGVGVAVGLVLAQVPLNVWRLVQVSEDVDSSPYSVLRRIEDVRTMLARTHHEGPVTVADMDMGAHLLWSDFTMVDFAGLVDVPIAHHHWQRAFLREHLFVENRPFSMHVHDFWEKRTGILKHPELRRDYIDAPPAYTKSGILHEGTYLRRDVLFQRRWPYGGRASLFEGGVLLYAPHVPAATVPDGELYVEVGMSNPGRRGFRVLLFATDGEHTRTWDLAPAYDWLPPEQWRPREVFVGRYALPVGSLPPGTYDLGFVVLNDAGEVAPTVGTSDSAVVARGEVRLPGTLTVLTVEARDAACEEAEAQVAALASQARCEQAEEAWGRARHLREGDEAWSTAHAPPAHDTLSACWARAAEGEPERAEQVRRLLRGKGWSFRSPDFVAVSRAVAAELFDEGLAARDVEDWEAAYRAFSDAVALDGRLTWARRYAEEARAHRLGLEVP